MPAQDLTIKRSDGLAGQVRYNVTRQTGYGLHKSAFVGSVHGSPGPVVCVLMDGVQFFVDSPERFGQNFNRDWIRNFYR
jgi:hypothetical protein